MLQSVPLNKGFKFSVLPTKTYTMCISLRPSKHAECISFIKKIKKVEKIIFKGTYHAF